MSRVLRFQVCRAIRSATAVPFAGAVFSLGLLAAATPLAAQEPLRPYLAPWISVAPGDARLAALAALPEGPVCVNSPGLLLEVPHESLGDPAVEAAARALVIAARRAGWRSGLSVELHGEPEPVEGRAAEAATAETIFPGLGRLLEAGREADLFVLSFPELSGDARSYRFVISKVAARIHAENPRSRIAPLFFTPAGGEGFPAQAAAILTDDVLAYLDLIGIAPGTVLPALDRLRQGAGEGIAARSLLVRAGPQAGPDALLALAGRLAPQDVPFVAAPLTPAQSDDETFTRLGRLLTGEFGHDGRAVTARAEDGRELSAFRVAARDDLGGIVVVTGVDTGGRPVRGGFQLALDDSGYSAAEVTELATGRQRRFDVPRRTEPLVLTLSLGNGPLAIRLTPAEKAPGEAAQAFAGVTAVRGLSVEEILAHHQVWRARSDARWKRLVAKNATSLSLRLPDLDSTFEVSYAGPFFFERGRGYDWAWQEAFVNGVRWRGKSIPEIPLVQPERVSQVPLTLTFDDAYRYQLAGEETIAGILCRAVDFQPKEAKTTGPLYSGRVFLAVSDYAVLRTKVRQLNLTGDVQSVDETTDYAEVSAPDGGAPIRIPTRTRGYWVLKAFGITTGLDRETVLSDVRLDPPDWESRKASVEASDDVMVRDAEKGLRYLEKDATGQRAVTEDAKTARLFGLGGVFWDSSLDSPLPLAGVYYLDLDLWKQKKQVQVFFAGLLAVASYSDPSFLGSGLELGVDVLGVGFKSTDKVYLEGNKLEDQRVSQRSMSGTLNAGVSLSRHLKLTASLRESRFAYGRENETSPDFTVPSSHWLTGLELKLNWDSGGWAVAARHSLNRRSDWEPWGYAGNPEYDSGKDHFRTWSVEVNTTFRLPRFRRIRTGASYLGSENTDRFSKYTFGSFGGTSLRGFSGGSLRAESAVILRGAYGFVLGDVFRLEGIYDHAFVKDAAAGLDWASFGGAGVSGQLPGPWSTIVQLDAGLPVVGRQRGQKGFVLNLVFLKAF